MNEMPIRRKMMNYPKDFTPISLKPAVNNQRFDVNYQLQTDRSFIKQFEDGGAVTQKPQEKHAQKLKQTVNPQKFVVGMSQLEQDRPLNQHSYRKNPDLDVEMLKKPRFSLNNQQEIPEKFDSHLQNSTSPGSIRKQLESRQTPLPLSNPFKIELVKSPNQKSSKVPNSIIKFKASAEMDSKRWMSSEKDLIAKFKQSRMKKSVNELPIVSTNALNGSMTSIIAKQQYENFRKRQRSLGGNMSKVSNFLASIKKKEGDQEPFENLPRFQSSAVERLRDEINILTRNKKGQNQQHHQDQNYDSQESGQSEEEDGEHFSSVKVKKNEKISKLLSKNRKLPQYLVSYRSSLSYLKDLHSKVSNEQQYKLVVKIPKLFTEKLIFKHQEKAQLYEISKQILKELNLPYENITIKRYTNCIMIISRNICLIWHYNGKRYLGGWQTEYLDEGFKHGLGLEWQPKSYVYYGEFVRNKKQGLGVYKDRNELVYVGYWKKGKQFQNYENEYDSSMITHKPSQNYEQYMDQYEPDQDYEYI